MAVAVAAGLAQGGAFGMLRNLLLVCSPLAPAGGGGPMAACRDDMQKFCADKTGPDRRACMQDNHDKLSDACKQALAARMQSR